MKLQPQTIRININPAIPALPKVDDKTKINLRYTLISPYVSVHIYWDKEEGELIYKIEEPILTDSEKSLLQTLEISLNEMININVLVQQTTESRIEYIDKNSRLLIEELDLKITEESYRKIFYYLFRDFIGLNEIEPMMRDYFIEDIECNGVNTPVYIVHRLYRNIRTNIQYSSFEDLTSFVEKLAQRCGKYISYANPLLDGSLPDGSRVNATYTTDVTSRGPTFCFKEGYIQLNDGRIKKVKDLFEESKENFGFKIEKENEIVEPLNMNCCGVDEKDLQQKNSRIKSIIKLKPPKKLVKINFEDGGEMEVTLGHLFHVADDSLKLVKAMDLKKGMIVPMPKKINALGYRQKINVYSLIKDFSYSKKICVISTPEIQNLVANEIQLNSQNQSYRQILSQKYNVANAYFYEIINRGNSISFTVLDKICQEQSTDFSLLGEISINVYGGGTKNKTKTVKVPKELDEDLAYLTGVLISDGHLSKDAIDFSCYEKGVKNSVKKKLLNKFGRFDSFYNDNRIYLCNQFVPFFFNKLFNIPIGKKTHIVKIPDLIFKSDEKVIASFIKGLFDGDGSISGGLNYKTFSKELAEGLTYLLARLGIYSYLRKENEGGYRVNIPSPYYNKYMDLIGFDEINKSVGLNKLVKKQIEYKTFIRHGRIPGAPILSIIKKLGLTRNELIKNCNFSFNRFGYTMFSRHFAKSLLREILKNERVELVKDEIDYIRWMLNTEQEFVKIDKIEMIDNSEPVYDIELEPCKFFIAGNKPMNIFDTIRKFTKIPWTPVQLINNGTISPEMLAYFWILLEYRSNILISGGTASGKTTMLNALAFFIPPELRVVSIEDTREIHLPRENWLPSVARTALGQGTVGEVDLFSLLRNSFRQNPDYVIVGEVRGKEAFVLFQGMASGHSSISTMHADSVDTLVKRLETPPIELSPSLLNTLDCIAVMTHALINKQEKRKLREITEIINVDSDGVAVTNTPFVWSPQDNIFYSKKHSSVFEKISKRYGITIQHLEQEIDARARLLYELQKRKIFDFHQTQKIINEYHKNPQAVMSAFGL